MRTPLVISDALLQGRLSEGFKMPRKNGLGCSKVHSRWITTKHNGTACRGTCSCGV